jgi:type I restriction enzyme S subunit
MNEIHSCNRGLEEFIPDGWAQNELSDLWTVLDCKHVTADFVAFGFPVASIRETQARTVDLCEAKNTTEKFYNILIEGGRKPRLDDLIFSRNATVGEVARVTESHPPFAMGQDVCLLRKRIESHSAIFFQYYLKSQIVSAQLRDFMVGSTFKRVYVAQIKSLRICTPQPHEQQAIAEALDVIDELIASLDALIVKKRNIKQAAMQQLLTGKTRLPGFEEEWAVIRLGRIVEFSKGRGLPKSALNPGGSAPCIHYGELFTHYGPRISSITSRTFDMPTAAISRANDVLMPTSDVTPRGLAKASCVLVDGVIIGGDALIIRPDPAKINGVFLAYLIRESETAILNLVRGSTVFHIYASDLSRLELRLPKVEEQIAIAEVLTDMDTELEQLAAKRAKATSLKEGMMQQLLTGRIRLV